MVYEGVWELVELMYFEKSCLISMTWRQKNCSVLWKRQEGDEEEHEDQQKDQQSEKEQERKEDECHKQGKLKKMRKQQKKTKIEKIALKNA